MTNKLTRVRNDEAGAADEIETLYLELLHSLYEEEDWQQAREIAERLETNLGSRQDFAGSIRAEEIYSLLAELRGDLTEAIQRRESEIRKILELHSLAVNKPSWKYVFHQYDYDDVSDRLDLLAILYADQGDLGRAVEVLQESRRFCESHEILFDGQDLLNEYELARQTPDPAASQTSVQREALDMAVRAAYRKFHQSADEILLDDKEGRRFAAEVNRRLPDESQATIKEIKRRLLTLRRRGEKRRGLPKLRP